MQKIRSIFHIQILVIGSLLVDLIFLLNNADPLNPVKSWVIGLMAMSCVVGLNFKLRKIDKGKKYEYIFSLLILVFILSLTWAFINTDQKTIGLLGYTGRNNGYLSYLFLAVISSYLCWNFRRINLQYIFIITAAGLTIFTIYGLVQHFKLDPILWKTEYNPITLTLGNPDFAAALLGLFTTLIVAYLFFVKGKLKRATVLILILVSTVVIYWTRARQGLIAIALGLCAFLIIMLWKNHRKLSLALGMASSAIGFLAILGMLQIGPLTHWLYKDSIRDRGYNWRAAIGMFKSHLLTGVGLDRYAAYFHEFQSRDYPLIYGYSQSVNNAHNVFLELFATGGIALGASYLLLTVFIGIQGLRAIRNTDDYYKPLVVGLFAGWLVFQAQSFISVDNLAVSIWGWALGGILISLGRSEKTDSELKNETKKNQTLVTLSASAILIVTYLIFIVSPMYSAEAKMNNFPKVALPKTPDELKIYNAFVKDIFDSKFLNNDYKVTIAFNVTNAGDHITGRDYFEKIIADDPRRQDVCQFLGTIYEFEKNLPKAIYYRERARLLNPYGAENLIKLANDYVSVGDKAKAKDLLKYTIDVTKGNSYSQQAIAILSKLT